MGTNMSVNKAIASLNGRCCALQVARRRRNAEAPLTQFCPAPGQGTHRLLAQSTRAAGLAAPLAGDMARVSGERSRGPERRVAAQHGRGAGLPPNISHARIC